MCSSNCVPVMTPLPESALMMAWPGLANFSL
jgi:hypothetical protein